MRQLEFYFDASLFAICFFARVRACVRACVRARARALFVGFVLLLLQLREKLQYGWNVVLRHLFVLAFIHIDLLCDHFCTGGEKF